MENPYKEKIDLLVSGEITELIVEKEDFLLFREVWLTHPEKNNIIGEAGLCGKVVYRKTQSR